MSFLVPSAGDTIDEGAARLTLVLQQADKANNGANKIKSALASIFTALGVISGSAARRTALAEANARFALEIADLNHQFEQRGVDLVLAQTKLEEDQKLDPRNPELEAEDSANIATINTAIADLSASVAQLNTESAFNTAQIASLQSSFLVGFTLIARIFVQRLSEEQQTTVAHDQTVIATVQEIYDDLRGFLDDTQVAEILRLVRQQQVDDTDVAAGATGQVTDARQIQDSAVVQSPLTIPGEVSRTQPDQAPAPIPAAETKIVPIVDASRPVEIPAPAKVPAPVDDPDAQDDARDIAAAEAATRQQQDQTIRAADAVEPAPSVQISPGLRREDLSPEEPSQKALPQNPVPAIGANAGDQRAVLQKNVASNTLERGTLDRISDARASDARAQQNVLITEVTRRADELATRLDRLVQRFVKSDAPLGSSLTIASLQDQETPGRRRLPV